MHKHLSVNNSAITHNSALAFSLHAIFGKICKNVTEAPRLPVHQVKIFHLCLLFFHKLNSSSAQELY